MPEKDNIMGEFLTNALTGPIPLEAYLLVSSVMFFAGVYGFLTRKSTLLMLIAVELMLNSVDLNFVVFNRYLYPEHFEGFYFTLFTVAISAAETAVAIAIIINVFRNTNSVDVDNISELKE